MYSKFDCYNVAPSVSAPKETKLQEYLRLKNEHIMEKCFNFKKENKIVSNNKESLKQLAETNIEMQPDESSKADDLRQQTILANASEDVVLPPANNYQEPATAINAETETASQKLINATKAASNSKLTFNSKSYKCHPSKRATSTAVWQSPFRTFITKGLRMRTPSSEFAYDLSRDELKFNGHFSSPMKPTSVAERQLLKEGQRRDYLSQRYEHSPAVKYNYPEATSWRIGWLQQKQ